MAFSQKLSLRAYSFCFRKWRGRDPEQILPLNSEIVFNRLQDGEEQTYTYASALELIQDFIGANTDTDDKEDSQQLFRCSFDASHRDETDEYRYLIFSVYAGYYGYASELVDRKTKNTVHKKSRDEADVKQFWLFQLRGCQGHAERSFVVSSLSRFNVLNPRIIRSLIISFCVSL